MSTGTSAATGRAVPVTGLRPVVCVQGLGFVGTAMALAVAGARDERGAPAFDVVGVELDSAAGRRAVGAIGAGRLPVESSDADMQRALDDARRAGNLHVTVDPAAYALADVAVMSINLDLSRDDGAPSVDFSGLRAAARSLAERMPEGALIVLETTVPPGTCESVVAPEIEAALEDRSLPPGAVMLAYSYERVMPGPQYLESLTRYWRVYAGHTPTAADACADFLSRIIDVDSFPLTRVASTTAAEIGKVLENSYRATTIAFMEEWGRFAEAVDVDLFEVIDAIRVRPSHSNMRQPGFGVGGYCLPKDPLFAGIGARELFGLEGQDFEFSERAVRVNEQMPLVTLAAVERLLGGLDGRSLLVLGVSYRDGVADTRSSPAATLCAVARERGAEVACHDPIAGDWDGPVPLSA